MTVLAGAGQVQWLKLPAWKVGDRGFEPNSGLQVSKKQNDSSRSLMKIQYCEGNSVTERKRAQPQTDKARIFYSCVWRALSSHSSHYPQEVFLAKFSLYIYTEVA